MSVRLDGGDAPAIDLPAFLAGVEAMAFDPDCEGNYAAAAPLIGALARDPTFLGDFIVDELRRRARGQEATSDYGPQVLLLHRGPGWFVRANIWPDRGEALYRASGPAPFVYDVPHDHNFTFLTVGYLGPGYWSDYYEVEPDDSPKVPGAPGPLRFVERAALGEGCVRLYRSHRDVHSQQPPDRTSVSLNLAQGTAGRAFLDQYRYDVDRKLIAGQLAVSATDGLVALMPALGGAEGADLLARFARHHPSDRIRYGAIMAQAAAAAPSERARLLLAASGDANRMVAALAAAALEAIESAP